MGEAIDLMINYPKTKRNLTQRASEKTEADRQIARQFNQAFFDGDRKHGYGGFQYHPRFWGPVIPTFIEHFQLSDQSSVLDVGCAKGFMLYDLQQALPGIKCAGIDISEYAIQHAHPPVKSVLTLGNATYLPYPDKSFDVVISITTLHNLDETQLIKALQEIERVQRNGSFITLDAYRNDQEKQRMEAWNLTAKTVLHVDAWPELFDKAGFTGDYYWFTP